jgi:nucleoside-diphosphate kinase
LETLASFEVRAISSFSGEFCGPGFAQLLCFITSCLKELTLALERTFAIIKPDAVSRGQQGEVLARIHRAGFTIVAIKSMRLTKEEAGGFYAVHKARPFFGELTDFMSSGKIIAMVLEAEGAISKWRDTMGATDPKKAAPGTIRHDLGTSIGTNCTHGSDAPDTAAFEISYFFSGLEVL